MKNIKNVLTFQAWRNTLKLFEITDPMSTKELLTIEEVADYLRVKRRTIYDWVKKRKIPAIKTVGQWRFKREKIDAWLESKG